MTDDGRIKLPRGKTINERAKDRAAEAEGATLRLALITISEPEYTPQPWHTQIEYVSADSMLTKLCTQFDLSGCAVSFGCHDLF